VRCIVDIIGIQDDGLLCAMAERILEVVIDNNRYLMRLYGDKVPPMYSSGVRFRNEPWAGPPGPGSNGFGLEQFTPFPTLIRRGWMDCAQAAPWLVAERREHGDPKARLRFFCRTKGDRSDPHRLRSYHVEVRNGDGEIQDPSRWLEF
jgi:hypothetical protein